jgi:tetratricopeptide (TPR) repeat protein
VASGVTLLLQQAEPVGQTGVNHLLFALLNRYGPMVERLFPGLDAQALVNETAAKLRRGHAGAALSREQLGQAASRHARERGAHRVAERDLAAAILDAAAGGTAAPTSTGAAQQVQEPPTVEEPAPAIPQVLAPGPGGVRDVRVFVSSTFRDMRAERDELVKRVFPRLRKLCEQRGVTWGEVDLRWGITDEQAAEGQVLPVCLDEIRRCRPYFIGLLGERYGWVPEEVAPELVEREPWLAQHRGRSVTELEIVHGVLGDPEMAEHSFFYLRDPAYVESLPEAQRAAFREGPAPEDIAEHGIAEAARRAEQRRQKLTALKERIRASGLPVRNYPDPETLGQMILADLTAVIDRRYPEGSQPDPLAREAAEHEAFARSRAGVYIGRQAYLGALDAHAAGDGEPLVILGESGSGKSALLANWARGYRQAHPDVPVVLHFIGSSPHSTDWAAMLRRIMGELARRFGIEGEIPDGADELRLAFANWLHMAAARGQVVLILDALNQLEDRQGAPDLVWLPPVIPRGVRLIVSTLPGRPQENLEARGWPVLEVEPLQAGEREELIRRYLAQYRKQLSPPRAERVARAEQCANPLFVRVLLEELRLWGEHETLDERIDHYLAAPTIPELYRRVLARWEVDYERDRPGLVGEALSLLWAARRGLSEAELLDLLGTDGEPLPSAHWSPFYLAAEQSLGKRAGLLGFAHDYLRQAVTDAYTATEAKQRDAHLRLADYFDHRRDEPRAVDELPWQLAEAAAWQMLHELLAEPGFFERGWEASEFDIRAYWARIEAGSDLRMAVAYRTVIDHPEQSAHAWQVAGLLHDAGYLSETLALQGHLVRHYRVTGDLAGLQASLGNQAAIFQSRGDLDQARALSKERERICRELGDRAGLARSLGNHAVLLCARGDLAAAVALHSQEERIFRELGDRAGLARSLGNQARILQSRGDLDQAMAVHSQEERIFRELGDRAGLARSLGNQAVIFSTRGDLDQAMALHSQQERICRELGNRAGLAIALNNQAVILRDRGDLDQAMALHGHEERICRELGDRAGLARSLGNQAIIFHSRGDLDQAMGLLKEQERICRELGDRAGLQASLGSQALILRDRGDLDQAMALHGQEERICRELGDRAGLARSLGNQACILQSRGDLDQAMALHGQEERICRELGDRAGLQASLGNQAPILRDRGDLDQALALHDEQERICRELRDRAGLAIALCGQALVFQDRGDLDQAMALLKEHEQICRELGNPAGLAISLGNQASVCVGMGQPREALPLIEEAYELATRYGLTALARQVEPMLEAVRSRAQ